MADTPKRPSLEDSLQALKAMGAASTPESKPASKPAAGGNEMKAATQDNPGTIPREPKISGKPSVLAQKLAEHMQAHPGSAIELSKAGGQVASANNGFNGLNKDDAAQYAEKVLQTYDKNPGYDRLYVRNSARTTLVFENIKGDGATRDDLKALNTTLTQRAEAEAKAKADAAAKAKADADAKAKAAQLESDQIAAGKSMRYPPGPPPEAEKPKAAAPAASAASATAPAKPKPADVTPDKSMRYPPGPPPGEAAPVAATAAPAAPRHAGPKFDPVVAATERFLIALGEKNAREGGKPAGNYHFLIEGVDGIKDKDLTVALKSFQENHGLKATGKIDKATITQMQKMAEEAGGHLGPKGANGVMDKDSIRAIATFDNLTGNFDKLARPAAKEAAPATPQAQAQTQQPAAAKQEQVWRTGDGSVLLDGSGQPVQSRFATGGAPKADPDPLGTFINNLPGAKDNKPAAQDGGLNVNFSSLEDGMGKLLGAGKDAATRVSQELDPKLQEMGNRLKEGARNLFKPQ